MLRTEICEINDPLLINIKNRNLFMRKFVSLTLSMAFAVSPLAQAELPLWSYDAGPDPQTEMGRELIDITASIPDMPSISRDIVGRKQKFRPAFGPIPWRMLQEKNAVKILFMGQDGTHIAEAAGRPATAGFGGRAQDFANYFGVNEGAAFLNAYSFTIKGQYGVYNTPYIVTKGDKSKVQMANYVDNNFWAISNNLESPIVKWRNNLVDWIIRNNKDSMKLIVLFGGAARDAVATYARSKGATLGTRNDKKLDQIQVAETKIEYAGGNNTFPSLVGKDGRDLYEKMLGRKLDYTKSKDQKAVVSHLKANLDEYLKEMVFTKGGEHKNGMLNPAQLGGYDLDRMNVNGVTTRSLKGLMLDDGTIIENDIIVVSLPHPSSLSRTVMDAGSYAEGLIAASKRVMRDVKKLEKYAKDGWEIEADPGKVNFYAKGENYQYGRSDIGPEFYDFGTPANRMVSKSTAKRMSLNANVVIIGTRDNGKFSKSAIKEMTNARAAFGIEEDQLFIARPSAKKSRYVFDAGPGAEMAKLMITSLDFDSIYTEKSEVSCEDEDGKVTSRVEVSLVDNISEVNCADSEEKTVRQMSFDKDGIDAYNIKTHPSVSDFGHYRGKFDNAKVLILADPHGVDDLVTARALTGSRGQYLQSAMDALNIADDYLVLKTVPFGMDGANEKEWDAVLSQTEEYRENMINTVLDKGNTKLIIADGASAAKSIKRIVGDRKIKVVTISRGNLASSGITDVVAVIKSRNIFSVSGEFKARMENIPRSHLSFYSRIWEGTSGDRAITSDGIKYKGLAFAEVVPSWAYKQELKMSSSQKSGVSKLIEVLESNGLPLPYESIPKYLKRIENADKALILNIENMIELNNNSNDAA